jgi:general secretion pathway protein G
MNSSPNPRRNVGFSLVELVIVIVILAVLSAVALPRVSRGGKGADVSALAHDLAVIRTAIEIYAAEHHGLHPGNMRDASDSILAGDTGLAAVSFEEQLTKYSDETGYTVATRSTTHKLGPYLHKIPPLPVGTKTSSGNNAVSVVSGDPVAAVDPSGSFGWIYNRRTGQFIANSDETDEQGTDFSAY